MPRSALSTTSALCVVAAFCVACGGRSELPGCSEPVEPATASAASCPPLSPLPASRLLSATPPLGILASGCGSVYVILGSEPTASIARSTDGGRSFEPAVPLPPGADVPGTGFPRATPIAVTRDGTLYAAGRLDNKVVLFRGDGTSWAPPVVLAAAQPYFPPSVAARGSTVVVTWLEEPYSSSFWAVQSVDGGGSFGPAERLDPGGGHIDTAGGRSLCVAGGNTAVVTYFWCNGTDCGGPTRRGVVAISQDGGPFGQAVVVKHGRDWSGASPVPVVGCHADGASILAWTKGTADCTAGPANVNMSALSSCGGRPALGPARSVFREPFGCAEPYYPLVAVGDSAEFVSWFGGAKGDGGFALADRGGRLTSAPRVDLDLDGNGEPDEVLDACALGARYFAVLADGGPGSKNVIAFVADKHGDIVRQRLLGSSTWPVAGWVACDLGGRAHFVWSDHGTHYAALATGS